MRNGIRSASIGPGRRPGSDGTAAEVLACLLSTAQELTRASDLDRGLLQVAERLRAAIGYDNLAVLLLDDLGRELSFEAAVGYTDEVIERWRFGLGQGIVGTVAQSGEAILANSVEDDPRYLATAPGTRSELALPQQRVVRALRTIRR